VVVRVKDYLPLLWIVAAAILGCGLIFGAGAVGLQDINNAAPRGTGTVGFMDFTISNMNTMIAETMQAFSNLNSALQPTPGDIFASNTPTIGSGIVTVTPSPAFFAPQGTSTRPTPTSTRTPTPTATNTPTFTPTKTPTSTDTPTSTPTPTDTPTPTPTDTDTPTSTPTPTDTPTPTPTDTDTPTPTDILIPP
jgi:hypothetical protein